MGIKINKTQIKLASIGLLVITMSIAGLSYVSSKMVETKIYKYSLQTLPKGTFLEGLAIKFNRDDISCSGLVQFDCKIKNPTLYNPQTKLNILKAKSIDIGTFSKKGIRLGKFIKLYTKIEDIDMHKDLKEWNKLNKYQQNMKDSIFPLTLGGSIDTENFSNNEWLGNSKFILTSKSIDLSLKVNMVRILKINLDKLKKKESTKAVPNIGMINMIKDFEITVLNKQFDLVLYNTYLNEYNKGITIEEKNKINIQYLGKDSDKEVSFDEFKVELSKKFSSYEGDKDIKGYIESIKTLFSKNNTTLIIKGSNKNYHTLFEMMNISANQSKMGQLKYFDIIVKTEEEK